MSTFFTTVLNFIPLPPYCSDTPQTNIKNKKYQILLSYLLSLAAEIPFSPIFPF